MLSVMVQPNYLSSFIVPSRTDPINLMRCVIDFETDDEDGLVHWEEIYFSSDGEIVGFDERTYPDEETARAWRVELEGK